MVPRPLGLVRVPAEAGHAFEVRLEHDRTPAARDRGDQAIELDLGGDRLLARLRVPVVDDHERNAACLADPCEDRDVGLAAALDDRDLVAVGIVTERGEDRRQDELLRPALDEDHRARKEELASLGVELAHDPERLVGLERLGLDDVRPAGGAVANEDELLEPGDVEERGRVRRVENLVPVGREAAQPPVEVALSLRPQEQLGLLDEKDGAGHAGFTARPYGGQQGRGPGSVRLRLARLAERSAEEPDGVLETSGLAVEVEERSRARGGREKEHGRRAAPSRLRLLGWTGPELDSLSVREPCLDGHRAGPSAHVLGAGRRGRIEQRPDGPQERRLAGARLADERRHGAERELDIACGAVCAHTDGLEQGHRATLARGYLAVLAGRGSGSGVRTCSSRSRSGSNAGGSESASPRVSTGSSAVKPGPSVAISNRTPLGSRK